ncbi:unnamed protein product [Phytomonas sp. EM1]|nr:unnamed protein product [Phytomonas sp. EM1]|eukprot:CCW65333.1 unnamed protein product [Phytomonas sp. isolate EM1]
MDCKGESKVEDNELPLLVPDPDRPHLAWARYIKQQHYHLQRAFSSSLKHNCRSGTSESSHGDDVYHKPNSQASDNDLKCWQSLINSQGEAERLQEYARAMHYLATKYWEAPSPKPINSNSLGECEKKDQECSSPTTTASRAPLAETVAESTDAIPSRKRSRDSSTASTNVVDERVDRNLLEAIRQRRYDDRIQCSLDCVEAFYLGRASTGGVGRGPQLLFDELPLLFSRALKPWRRDFFCKNARMATKTEIEDRILQLSCETDNVRPTTGEPTYAKHSFTPRTAWDQSMRYVRLMQRARDVGNAKRASEADDSVSSVPALHAIDVGSCYGPFFGKSFSHHVLGSVSLHVFALDLCPYAHPSLDRPLEGCAQLSGRVWKGDWLSVAFFKWPLHRPASCTVDDGCNAPHLRYRDPPTEGSGGVGEVQAIALESFDVVFFCLFLSYLPSARLRYRACVNAYLSLKEGGLLVIVSTRTQGSRRRKWVEEWVVAISSVGFARVHQMIREKIVVLCFEKQSRPEMRRQLDDVDTLEQDGEVTAAVDALLEQLNRSPFASDGLHVMADEDI